MFYTTLMQQFSPKQAYTKGDNGCTAILMIYQKYILTLEVPLWRTRLMVSSASVKNSVLSILDFILTILSKFRSIFKIDFSSFTASKLNLDEESIYEGLNDFSECIVKYTRYSSLRPLATLSYTSDVMNNASIVSSIEFDKDKVRWKFN